MMKKLFNYALFGAIALTGAVGFTSCSSSDDVVENPNFNPETNEVTTQFVLNIASGEMPSTRQSADVVQKNNNFRGMQDAKLIALSTGKASTWLAPFEGTSTSYAVNKTYDLGTLYAQNAVTNSGTTNAESSSRRVVELTMPLTTDAMLVYGRAITGTDDEDNGKVVYSVNSTPENTTFDLVSRLTDADQYTQTCNLVALIINRIMLSEVTEKAATAGSLETRNGYTQVGTLSALTWRGLAAASSLSPLEENLKTLYVAATSFSTSSTAIRAGSYLAVCSMMKDIYSKATSVLNATATNDAELNAQRLASDIITRIERYFDKDNAAFPLKSLGNASTSGSIVYNLIGTSASLPTVYQVTAAAFASGGNYAKVTQDGLYNTTTTKGFPQTFMIPEGVSQLYFTAFTGTGVGLTGGFSYTNPSQSLISMSTTLDPTKYMYPSELLYFDNSLLRVTDAEKEVADYPNGYNQWDVNAWSGWTVGKVVSSTRSVAVKNNINYGVAMLQTKVGLKLSTGETKYKDNRHALVPTEENQEFDEDIIKGFTLKGILIGGQYKKLGWNYLAKAGATDNENFTIYDNKIVDGAIPTQTNKENYTLVFDNYNASGDQQDVLVALELQNGNVKDFYGKGGMIEKGATFYLVGKLQISSAVATGFAWPTYYAIPPYNTSADSNGNYGTSSDIKRVFIQDYMTTATFNINETSLQNAYNTVPDLRASQTSLGLSVDLNWRTGLSFETALGQ